MAGVWMVTVVVITSACWIQCTVGSCPAGKFGDSCSYSCHCGQSCNQTTGVCGGDCGRGWMGGRGRTCQKENIAYNKHATPRTDYTNWTAVKAVDGNQVQNVTHDSCFHSSANMPGMWIVDLGKQYRIHDVRIYHRDGHIERIRTAVLSLSNSSSSTPSVPCYTFPSNTAAGNYVYDVVCDGRGQYFTITHKTEPLNLCEVEIYVCSQGSFGADCSHFCHCSDGPCDGVSGICAGDCRPGWRGQNCSIECDQDHYGVNCNGICDKRKCTVDTSSCDRHTGSCDTDCLPGWTAVDCTQECSDGTYGQNCSKQCGDRNCAGNSSCDHVSGLCVSGCKAGWKGIDCVEVFQEAVVSESPASTPIYAGVAGVTLFGLVLVLIMVLIRRRKRTKRNHRDAELVSKTVQNSQDEGNVPMNVGQDEEKQSIAPKKRLTEAQPETLQEEEEEGRRQEGEEKEEEPEQDEKAEEKKKEGKEEQEENYDCTAQHQEAAEMPDRNYYNLDEAVIDHVIPVSSLQAKAREFEETPGLAEDEFKRLPNGFMHPYLESQMPRNSGKNRFRGYYPYDYNRVLLQDGEDGGDYINASYIDGYKNDKRYIAAQGADIIQNPLDTYLTETAPTDVQTLNFKAIIMAESYLHKRRHKHEISIPRQIQRWNDCAQEMEYLCPYNNQVVVDFWRMIMEKECRTVVTVTGLVEGGKVKCLRYWPEKGTKTYGDAMVTMVSETRLSNYTITNLSVDSTKDRKKWEVNHLHFTSWPDHGVPDTTALLDFMWRVKVISGQQTQPIIVHCSAGIGRTGTYIAVESLVEQAKTEGVVDVVSVVSNMRGQRKNMIQTKEQYLFVYQAASRAVTEGDTSVDVDVIRQMDLGCVSDITFGNRTVQEHLEALRNIHRGNQESYSIRSVQSYTTSKGFFIMTSNPDKEELWKQIYNSDSHSLITFAVDDLRYLPSVDDPITTEIFAVNMRSSTTLSDDILMNTIDINLLDCDDTTCIQHYHISGGILNQNASLMIDSFLTWTGDPQRGSSTIVSDSLTDCRLLVLLVNIVSRLQVEGRVDVINNMRHLFSRLGGPPFTEDDVTFCLEFVQRQLESSNVYVNF